MKQCSSCLYLALFSTFYLFCLLKARAMCATFCKYYSRKISCWNSYVGIYIWGGDVLGEFWDWNTRLKVAKFANHCFRANDSRCLGLLSCISGVGGVKVVKLRKGPIFQIFSWNTWGKIQVLMIFLKGRRVEASLTIIPENRSNHIFSCFSNIFGYFPGNTNATRFYFCQHSVCTE